MHPSFAWKDTQKGGDWGKIALSVVTLTNLQWEKIKNRKKSRPEAACCGYGLHTLQGRYPAEIASSRLEKCAVQFLQSK